MSIVLLAYNQEKIVEDALNSTLFQGYRPLELIVCDDASADGTKDTCLRWIDDHRHFFEKIHYERNESNIGISGNLSRGVSIAGGTIIKPLAGDNLLAPDAVMHAADFYRKTGAPVFFGNVKGFRKTGDSYILTDSEPNRDNKRFFSLDPLKQFRLLAVKCGVYEPGVFYERDFFEDNHSPDLDIRHIEDWSRWLTATSKGIPLKHHDFEAVYYRRDDHSHKDRRYEDLCLRDIVTIIDKVILPRKDLLSLPEVLAVVLNRKRHEKLLENRNATSRFPIDQAFFLSRFITRLGMLYYHSLLSPRDKFIRSPLVLPFDLKDRPMTDTGERTDIDDRKGG